MALQPRTVVHGIDCAVPDAGSLPKTENMGGRTFAEDIRTLWVSDSAIEDWLPHDYIAARWDFDSDGGAISTIDLDVIVPVNTIILDGFLLVLDPILSDGSAKIALRVGIDGSNVLDATVLGSLTEGLVDIKPNGTAGRAIQVTSERQVQAIITVSALTAGAFVVFLRCLRKIT